MELLRKLKKCRYFTEKRLIDASFLAHGGSKKISYLVKDKVDNIVSLYTATKQYNKLMTQAYLKLYEILVTGVINIIQKIPDNNEDGVKYKVNNIGK